MLRKDLSVGLEWCDHFTKVAQKYWMGDKTFVLTRVSYDK